MKNLFFAAAFTLLLCQCTGEYTGHYPNKSLTIRSITACLGDSQIDSRVGITVTPELDAYHWKEGDRIILFELEDNEFTGSYTVMELQSGAGYRIGEFVVANNSQGLSVGSNYMAVHAGALVDITFPQQGGTIGLRMPQTIDVVSDSHTDVEDNIVLWTRVSVSGPETPYVDFEAQFNDQTSIMEFHVGKSPFADFASSHNITSLRAATVSGAHFVQSVAVDVAGVFNIESYYDNINVNLPDQPELSEEPVIVRALVWWDQSITSSLFSFSLTTATGRKFTTADIPKNSSIGAGKTVRPIPILVDAEPSTLNGIWNGAAWAQPAVYNETAKTATIETAAELAWIAKQVNGSPTNSFAGWTITLGADIDLGSKPWTAIGNVNLRKFFSGTFDGNGHAIYNLYISSATDSYLGLFGYCNKAVVSNLTIGSGSVSGKNNIAGICAYANDTDIAYCRNRAAISGSSYVGGIAGSFNQSGSTGFYIRNCVNNGRISGTSQTNGIAGSATNNSNISECLNRGAINGV